MLDDSGEVAGFNVLVGGGMGMTHGEPDTYPRTGDVIGFCRAQDAVAVAEAVVTVQRDWGDRSNRKHARLKYTIQGHGPGALPTCGLALAESERYLPDLVTALDARLDAHGLADDDIVIRMTGCPNGCARPYLAEIALVGKGPGRYNLYLGAAFDGSRMAKLFAEDLVHEAIVSTLDPVLPAHPRQR